MAAHPEMKRMDSYQYPATHLGHLNAQQEKSLESFKDLCNSKKYYTPAGPDGQTEPSHDDETLLRYLRARKWSPPEAFEQFKDTEEWRKENQIDKLYTTIDIQDYEGTRKLYPQWIGRRDRRGIPVYVYEVAGLNSKAIAANETAKSMPVSSKVPPKMLKLFALYENLTSFVMPLCSALPDRAYPETPVSQSNNIVDISKVGLKQFWNLKSHMQDASTLATAHYPETLDRIFIIGAPSFFPTVWGWIKRWFDPITVSKIFILSQADMKKTLEQYIAPEDIPKKYGGKLDFEFGQLPNLDPAIDAAFSWSSPAKQNGKRTFPIGPIRWVKSANGDLVAVAVGAEGGKLRETEVGVLKAQKATKASKDSLAVGGQPLQMYRTTSGVDTHPPSPPPEYVDLSPPRSDSEAPTPAVIAAAGSGPMAPGETASLPIRSGEENATAARQGTSHTRYEQQNSTIAGGQLAEGTPLKHDAGDGDSYAVMEPNTVAQAPKEHPVPEPEAPQASYIDQAKGLAGSAYTSAAAVAGSALGAVGLSKEGKQVEEGAQEEAGQRVPDDPAVDQAQPKHVEEFLRSQYPSVHEANRGA